MSHELDIRARRAAANLQAAVANAELTSVPPGTTRPRRALITILRPVWVATLLLIGSAVGLALVLESSPPTETPPPATPTTVVTTTTLAPTTTQATTPTTTAAVVPVAPPTTEAPADTQPPPLEITYPAEGEEMTEKTITFAGTTEPGARVFAGRYEAEVDAAGNWEIVLILNEGSNVARFVARDAAGNETGASVTVYFTAPTTTTQPSTPSTDKGKEEESPKAEFTAHATFGSCSETPPYDVYYGTGEPGSLVHVVSEYGSGSVEVGGDGKWELEVVFTEAPPGEFFLVKAKDEYGRKVDFEFIYQP